MGPVLAPARPRLFPAAHRGPLLDSGRALPPAGGLAWRPARRCTGRVGRGSPRFFVSSNSTSRVRGELRQGARQQPPQMPTTTYAARSRFAVGSTLPRPIAHATRRASSRRASGSGLPAEHGPRGGDLDVGKSWEAFIELHERPPQPEQPRTATHGRHEDGQTLPSLGGERDRQDQLDGHAHGEPHP